MVEEQDHTRPESQNGHGKITDVDREPEPKDYRAVYFIMALVLLAFVIGILLLMVAIMSDWQ